MYLDFAPMEGITGSLFRRLHAKYFSGVDRYYTPFLSPTSDHRFTPREQREFFPEYNRGVPVVPQIMTKVPEDFLWAAGALNDMGYEEVNLNLGCPSGTVTAKGKGAGMLAEPDRLDRFLEEIFSGTPCAISIKTRLGMEDPAEFDALLRVFNRYPLAELIIHPRVRKDFYRNPVRREAFDAALPMSRNPVSYNGGLETVSDIEACAARYPQIKAIMLGQGLVADPFLAGRFRSGTGSCRKTLRQFHDDLLEGYTAQFDSRLNAVKRMKELWVYQILLFENGEKPGRKILKAKSVEEYLSAVHQVFCELPLLDR